MSAAGEDSMATSRGGEDLKKFDPEVYGLSLLFSISAFLDFECL